MNVPEPPAQRQAEVLGTRYACAAKRTIQSTDTILLCKVLVVAASSLPSPVLRSMLKQRRILMRMH